VIDSHCHIDGADFDGDRDEVLARAAAAGVEALIVVGTGPDLAAIRRAPALAAALPNVYCAVGVHPHDAARFPAGEWAELEALAAGPRCVAIGETGLDFHYDLSPRDEQARSFRRHVQLARRLGKPVVCHVRDAHELALTILIEEGAAAIGAVIHCFTGGPAQGAAYVAAGVHLSFSGIVTFKGASAEPIREAARQVPLDRLLLETDAPFLAPVPLRGKRNEPAFMSHTASFIAGLRGMVVGDLVAASAANTRKFFDLTPP
jgi:TatD DNase family protein